MICRWRRPDGNDDDLILDAMPAAARLLGFTNEWQARGLAHAANCLLPSGTAIRAIGPPYLLATKLEAFRGRGGGDHLASRDLEDIVLLVDGREELTDEMADAEPELRAYISEQIGALLDEPRFVDAVFGFLRPDMASQQRAEAVVLPRLRELAGG